MAEFCVPAGGPGCPTSQYDQHGCLIDTYMPFDPATQMACPGFVDDKVSKLLILFNNSSQVSNTTFNLIELCWT